MSCVAQKKFVTSVTLLVAQKTLEWIEASSSKPKFWRETEGILQLRLENIDFVSTLSLEILERDEIHEITDIFYQIIFINELDAECQRKMILCKWLFFKLTLNILDLDSRGKKRLLLIWPYYQHWKKWLQAFSG